MRVRRGLTLFVAVLAGLAVAQAAFADKLPVRYTAADQAAARAAVMRKSDLGTATGWTGGATKPDLSEPACGGYEPKRSDLLLTGAASSRWKHTSGVSIVTEAWVLKSETMVKLDWQRTVEHPTHLLQCVKAQFASEPSAKFVSFKQIAFPRLASLSRRCRLLVDYVAEGQTIRVMADLIVIGMGRTEISLLTTAPYAARQAVEAAELRLAQALVARARV